MALFEVMTALSASLAIAIPTFTEKVMRPKYEERFSEFTRARRESFIDEFEDAFNQLKQAKEEMTPEIVETMETLFNEWGQVRTDETKLNTLLSYRKFFYVGWFVSCALCLFSIEFSETLIPMTEDVNLGTVAMTVFVLMLSFSLLYGVDLFILDEKLSKFRAKTTGETYGTTEGLQLALKHYRELDQRVEGTLKKFRISFDKEVVLKTNSMRTHLDYVIPSTKNPKYLIEIKARPRASRIYALSLRFQEIKKQIPVKTILISNFRDVSANMLKLAQEYWDFVVDYEDLDKLKEIIKL